MTTLRLFGILCAIVVCVMAPTAVGQQPAAGGGPALATRAALTDEAARLERGDTRSQALATFVRARLVNGDFQFGDRIFVRVDGESQLTDTFTVNTAGDLELPQLGVVALHGVLRSELQERVQQHLARFLRNPVVQVRPLMRLLVEGDVVRPGFYVVAPQQALADVITQAGGLTQRAKPSDMRVERGDALIWSGEPLRQALGSGSSVDQLNLRAGDRVFVPERGNGDKTWRVIGLLLSLPVVAYSISQIR